MGVQYPWRNVCNVFGVEASMVMQWTVNPPPSGTPGSIPGYSTKFNATLADVVIAAV